MTQQYQLASVVAWPNSTGISHHTLLPHIPAAHLSVSYNHLYFFIGCNNLSFFHFCLLIWLFSPFFLIILTKSLSILFISLNNQFLVFINLYYCFFHLSLWFASFSNFGFVLFFFSSHFGCKSRLSIRYFSCFFS